MDVKMGSNSHVIEYFHITCVSLTFLFMICSDTFVRFSRQSPPTSANPNHTTIINTIPFSNLNTSIALTIVVHIISNMLGVRLFMGVHASLVLATLLLTNKRVGKHLRIRLRQKFDSLTVGRSDNLCVRQNFKSLTIGRINRVEPVVTIALVPNTNQGFQRDSIGKTITNP